ncbi:hypothetical protein K443DRAFT_673610 [Laccaria amethystina LaAM-08-1]|uniref:Unplaced genomic scaffold K443scaffold_13, whole genome shotgun sequence n=1 Tax=Laccaria amethystina LaAM-08-1 TaxID=1095629 RepID=A0A0C9Y080_9AGAR|nr:hypothetical protein K443DRAFT_673610 [Laccaria amethystina LaAM-08-1]
MSSDVALSERSQGRVNSGQGESRCSSTTGDAVLDSSDEDGGNVSPKREYGLIGTSLLLIDTPAERARVPSFVVFFLVTFLGGLGCACLGSDGFDGAMKILGGAGRGMSPSDEPKDDT